MAGLTVSKKEPRWNPQMRSTGQEIACILIWWDAAKTYYEGDRTRCNWRFSESSWSRSLRDPTNQINVKSSPCGMVGDPIQLYAIQSSRTATVNLWWWEVGREAHLERGPAGSTAGGGGRGLGAEAAPSAPMPAPWSPSRAPSAGLNRFSSSSLVSVPS